MKELLVATRNNGKLKEIELLLKGVVDDVLSYRDFPHCPDVVEDGETFAANAVKKARQACLLNNMPAVADDSGLVVDALGGLPGVHSARFAGEGANDTQNNAKLLQMLSEVPEEARGGAFCCVVALCFPDGQCHTFDGRLPGIVLDRPRGCGGFGYDPLFSVPAYGQTLAELPIEVKNAISHRGQAFSKLKAFLQGQYCSS